MTFISWGEGPFSISEATTKDPKLNQPDYAYDNKKKCSDCGKPGLKLNSDGTCPACVQARAKEDGLQESSEYPKIIKARGDREDVVYRVKTNPKKTN
jgi:hypothetical protein